MNYIDSISEYLPVLNTGVYIIRVLEDGKMCIRMLVFSQGQVNLYT